ncbi:pimeloyl-ACP methyl ester carboxylesterase [Nocardioides albertanoniae]|uniref:Pimeloyl-ACP methyl ester carboxylesterase n=2 Tax=Nocardioides albertanoniae TaxID=1175486 RepID=A0A543AAU4_9ACTN|nr:pimeloyl-ACP methyl ester carboxylesterase [Nocardioides albertanoniae]
MPVPTRTRLPLPGRGATYVYDVHGPEHGVPMVLLHELGGTAKRWRSVIPRLAAAHRTYAFDLRGHGETDWASEYSLRLIADDIIVAMDELGISGAVLVGHSAGSVVALLVAMHRPDLVAGLVIEDGAPPSSERDRKRPGRLGKPVAHDWECVAALMVEATIRDEWMWEQLSVLPMPTLVVAGGGNSHIPRAELEDVARRIPISDLVCFDVGHFVHRNQPAEFAETVLSWIASRVGSPSLRTPPARRQELL